MRPKVRNLSIVLILSGGIALAHTGVQNPAVKARMGSMGVISSNTKVLVEMVRGKRPFNAEAARAAAAEIAHQAKRVPVLFKAEETDPKSEAAETIWDAYGEFTSMAREMETAAIDIAAEVTSLEALRPAISELAGSCQSCHESYRVSK